MKQNHMNSLLLELFSMNIFDSLKSAKHDIPTKSRPCQMNAELVEFCKNEIDNLLQKGLIKSSKSPWSCTTFYVNNAVERECSVPRLDQRPGGSPPNHRSSNLASLS
ncbi:hypothetical protein H5410_022043 [Solanum commersonii]|uniref:Reverse transcriptase n=1 Tax=Solanum commersonii TaxID=4109 RepID=A0A9J5ZDN5_SOLCO|nr:hypothetical protein H5410_022043 [Solanum commersonii]